MELFVLFDKSGLRTKGGEHVLDYEVRQRAAKRKAGQASNEDLPKNYAEHAAILRPALDAELARFKAIVRHIARHEFQDQHTDMFTMDDNSKFRRLAKLGIYGHQLGIAAHVRTTNEEEQGIVEGLLAQKVGSNPKSLQACKDYIRAKAEEDCPPMKVKIARLSTKSIVKWKRDRRDDGEEPLIKKNDDKPTYASRLLTCSVCYQPQETRWMQLRTTKGFRAIQCKYCKYQEYTAKTNCQCGGLGATARSTALTLLFILPEGGG